mmetsp:Transcript_12319/g.26598  ORF Transcript_12319/g.26598 Transcript_12319/m.26598 type:complete len:225 (-) Transcript_12319:778-1452(-)|eukprot:CAMPEP_0202892312 /NCGR_PEP_ID=MMETSP1392-20130828/2043_1 /ASSEMBLY_ACC=CAM_ASM_000868 /TAXON_ID=225041 /ORGANISM="Chlamydomonas chlamydogama, Strain SAG 11-48b" /LENGTH=224 /DNA_ID=CAMNT_0049576209 /DNA_START=104 /DNA_END=778 /DNA_ORIENTATION=+
MADDEEAPPTPQWLADKEGENPGPYNEDGLPHGKGVMKYPPPPVEEDEDEKPGDMYEGPMENGKRQGKGKYTWSNGTIYEGDYVDNKKHGRGKFTFPDKSTYEGEFVEDRIEGQGTYVYSNGDIYQGQFLAGKRHGKGMYHYNEVSCQMVGEWADGGFTHGRWVYKDGSMFYGDFKGMQPAQGAYYFSTSQLLQRGTFGSGTWLGDEPLLGKVDQLTELYQQVL